MHTFSLAEAEAQLGRLIDLVEAGEEVAITRYGEPVVRLVLDIPVHQQLPSLAAFRARLPIQTLPAGEFVRQMRESDRY